MENNIFNYATSELSQDAFFVWLLSWVKEENKNLDLYKIGKKFLESLNPAITTNTEIEAISMQYDHTDILVITKNPELAIIIEDKVYTTEHGNQIAKYKKDIFESFNGATKIMGHLKTTEQIKAVYLKTGNFKDENKNADVSINRKKLLEILKSSPVENDIFNDYLAYIQNMEDIAKKWEEENNVSKWGYSTWEDFLITYFSTETSFLSTDYCIDYVSNPRGGFLCLWFTGGYDEKTKTRKYKQLEITHQQNIKFCYKMSFEADDNQSLNKNLAKAYQEIALKERPDFKAGNRLGWTTTCAFKKLDFKNEVKKENLIKEIKEFIKE